jgi:hypothetical protein
MRRPWIVGVLLVAERARGFGAGRCSHSQGRVALVSSMLWRWSVCPLWRRSVPCVPSGEYMLRGNCCPLGPRQRRPWMASPSWRRCCGCSRLVYVLRVNTKIFVSGGGSLASCSSWRCRLEHTPYVSLKVVWRSGGALALVLRYASFGKACTLFCILGAPLLASTNSCLSEAVHGDGGHLLDVMLAQVVVVPDVCIACLCAHALRCALAWQLYLSCKCPTSLA